MAKFSVFNFSLKMLLKFVLIKNIEFAALKKIIRSVMFSCFYATPSKTYNEHNKASTLKCNQSIRKV